MMRTIFQLPQLVLSLVVLAGMSSPLLAAGVDGPRIVECRVGFESTLKVGHWTPVWVDIEGDLPAAISKIELTAIDSDGVEVTVAAAAKAGEPNLLFTRIGRLGSGLEVRLVAEDGRVLDRAELSSTTLQNVDSQFTALPSTGTLILQIGPGDLELQNVLTDAGASDGSAVDAAVQIVDVAALPTEWFGYDAVDVVVLTTGDVNFCERLAADAQRFAALREWLELGGRLLVSVGKDAPRLIAAGRPFADLVPGRFSELVRLPQTQTLETFAASRDAISRSGAQQSIPLPLLTGVAGRVELFGRGTDLPIVVRAAHGFGELTFLGIDPAEEPFADWSGRTGLLRAVLRPYLPDAESNATKQKLVSLGYDDLAGALRQQLGSAFAGVSVLGFPLVAGLIIGYLLWLGPLDYLFIDRVVHRPWVAWLTLPVIVLATSLGAALLARASKSSTGPQINRAELVDVDLSLGLLRGTCWSALYSPEAELFDLGLRPQTPDGQSAANARTLLSWLGLPGRGLGGMHAAGEPIDVAGVGYRITRGLNELEGVPLLTAATKSFLAQWVVPKSSTALLYAQLSINDEGNLEGSITNNTGAVLSNVCLLSGQSGYRLGDFQPGEELKIGADQSPLRTRAILLRRVRRGGAGDQETFLADRATAEQILNVMMFYEALGGEGFAGLPNRYQSRSDLSRLLDLDRAILVAQSSGSGSQWTDPADNTIFDANSGSSTVLYRFLIPLTSDR